MKWINGTIIYYIIFMMFMLLLLMLTFNTYIMLKTVSTAKVNRYVDRINHRSDPQSKVDIFEQF